MSSWTPKAAAAIAAPQEIQVVTRRQDGTLRRPRTIWIVSDGDRVFIRSTNGREADWFRWAIATGSGQVISRPAHDVTFTESPEQDLDLIDAAYRAKYGGMYGSIVDHLNEPGPRAATLEVHPA